jgi:hypothetical protein
MKKFLLSLLFILPLFSSAQALLTDNFNSLNIGNISTETAGMVAGQGGYFLFSSNGTAPTTTTNANITNSQIIAAGNTTKGLQLEGPNGNKGNRFVWKDGLPALWSARTTTNNIIELEIDINPGAGTTTSKNVFGVYIYDATFNKVLVGFTVSAATRELFLVAYSTPAPDPVDNYSYSLAAAPGILLPANAFSRIGISYDVTTGEIIIKAPGIAAAGITIPGSAAGTAPAEIDFLSFSGSTTAVANSVSTTMVMDNLTVRASATDTLLDNASFESDATVFSVSPNPADDLITISSAENILVNSISITDLNGRVVKQKSYSNIVDFQVNVSDLASGVYMMNITSEKGSVTKKIIKN